MTQYKQHHRPALGVPLKSIWAEMIMCVNDSSFNFPMDPKLRHQIVAGGREEKQEPFFTSLHFTSAPTRSRPRRALLPCGGSQKILPQLFALHQHGIGNHALP